jgi:hypothetical protein
MVRASLRVKARSDAQSNSGKLDNGTPWSNRTFEGVDSDDNKIVLRLGDGVPVQIGTVYDVIADIAIVSGRQRITVVSMAPAAPAASTRAA